jgi:hypothetical protein
MYPILEFSLKHNDLHQARLHAEDLFARARRAATTKRLRATFRPASRRMAMLCPAAVMERYEGARTVRVVDIVGSENRVDDFDSEFYPLEEHLETRWVSVAMAMGSQVNLPPVELIEVEGEYYVRDGHHRVSVARMMGIAELDAVVVVYRYTATG